MLNADDARLLAFEANKADITKAINNIEAEIKKCAGDGCSSARFNINELIPDSCNYHRKQFDGYKGNSLDVLNDVTRTLRDNGYRTNFDRDIFVVDWKRRG